MADPLTKLQFRPGLNLDNALLASEDTFADGDKVRFTQGIPEFIGGRLEAAPGVIAGIARAGNSWPMRDGSPVAAFGTTAGLYALIEGGVREISPVSALFIGSGSATNNSKTFTLNTGSPGLVTNGNRVFVHLISSGANPDVGAVDGWGTATSVVGASATLTLDKAATATTTGDCLFGTAAPIVSAGSVDGSASERPAYWSMDNFGDLLVAVKGPPPNEASADFALHAWAPRTAYSNIINNPTMATDVAWAKGSGWFYSAATKKYYADGFGRLSQNIAGEIPSGTLVTAVFDVTDSRSGPPSPDFSDKAYAGVGYLMVNAGTPAAPVHVAPVPSLSTLTGTLEDGILKAKFTAKGAYAVTFYLPQTPSDIVFQAGTDDETTTSGVFGVDNAILFVWPNAYPVAEAPLNMSAVFTFNNVVVGLGGLQINAEYNPLNVRCCDLGNIRSWVPDTNSLATESQLRKGGRAVGGIATRNMGLIWTDAALYGLNWLGSAGQAFSLDLLGTGCGLIGSNAMCEQNGYVFWASKSGPYTFSGGVPQIVECSMKADVFENIAEYQGDKIWVRMLPKFNEVWFGYPDKRDDGGANKEVSRQAVFNFAENHWTRHIWDVTAWITPGVFDHPIGFSVESAATCKMMWHEMGGSDNGSALRGFLVTGAFDIEDGGNIMRITEVWPEWKNLTCDLTYTLNTRMYPHAPNMVAGTPMVLKPTTIPPLRPRRDGRQFQIKLEANTTTLGGRQGVLRVRAQKTGASR